MKKFLFFLILALCTSNLFAQKELYNDIIYPDEGTKGNTSVTYWSKYNLYYYIHNSASHNLTSTQCQTAIQNAFNKWAQYSKFTFAQTYNLSQADIELSWEPTNHSGCTSFGSSVLAHATKGQIDRTPPAFIHFNDDKTFTMTIFGNNLEYVALHEIGHVLGLEHDNHSDAVMYDTYEYKANLSHYDLTALYNIYGFYSITGPQLVNTNATYYIDNLPGGLTVEWSLSDSYYNQNCLQQNYPSQNQCTITRSSTQDMIGAILTATIKYNGITVQTLTRTGISAFTGFKGTYISSDMGHGQYAAPNPIFTGANSSVHIWSPKLIGATVTYTGDAIPTYWLLGYNTIDVNMPSTGGNTILIHVVCEAGDDYYIPVIRSTPPYYLSVNFDGEAMIVTLDDSALDNQDWTLEIYNVMNGEKVVTQNVSGNSVLINISGWKRGLYAARVTIGKEVLTEKVVVR